MYICVCNPLHCLEYHVYMCVCVCVCGGVCVYMCVRAILQIGYGVVHELDEGGGHVLQHVLEDEGRHDSDSDNLATLTDQRRDVLVLQPDHILTIHLQGWSTIYYYYYYYYTQTK